MPKRVLIFIGQPPGSNGVQATRYAKLQKPLAELGWELHFVGPNPKFNSVYLEEVFDQNRVCHYCDGIPYSRKFSVYRHRLKPNQNLSRLFYGACQLIFVLAEKVSGRNSNVSAKLSKAMLNAAERASGENSFDLIAGVTPDYEVLKTGYRFSVERNIPFLPLYHDPYGSREESGFEPHEKDSQQEVFDNSAASLFMSSLTRVRYINCGLVTEAKSFSTTDSFVKRNGRTAELKPSGPIIFSHMGNLATWRPISNLLAAWRRFLEEDQSNIKFANYGLIYPSALEEISGSSELTSSFEQMGSKSLAQSHSIAAQSDVLVVVIGPRHIDNLPSKFFEYLGHKKPYFVVGPENNPLQSLITGLGIGVYAKIKCEEDILAGLKNIVSNHDEFSSKFISNSTPLDKFECREVAKKWADAFEQARGRTESLV